jgi:hypothetical protein
MADVLLPTWLRIARLRTDYLDNTGMTRGLYTAAPETTGFGGDRLRLSLEFSPTITSHTDSVVERAAIRSFLARLRGRQNRALLWDPYYRQRGPFAATELLTNNTFDNSTTGWSAQVTTLTVADRVLRMRTSGTGQPPGVSRASIAVTQYAPYVLRSVLYPRISDGSTYGVFISDGTVSSSGYGTANYSTAVLVPLATTVTCYAGVINDSSPFLGDFLDIPWTSLSRCAQVDNSPNRFTQSDAIDHADWTKAGTTVTANQFTAPDGTVRGERILEDTSTGGHSFFQDETKAATAEDWCLAGEFRVGDQANARTRVALRIQDTTATDYVQAIFDLSAGTVVSITNQGTGSNARAFIHSRGTGWYDCYLVGRSDAETTIRGRVLLVQTGTTVSYTGLTDGDIGVGRMAFAQSSVPIRMGVTTTTTLTSGTEQTGSALRIKGLSVSTSGLLLPDDRVEIITDRGSEMKIVTASLDSDAAGRGYLQFEPPLRGTPADGAAVIVNQPMTRAIFAGDMVGFDDSPGIITAASAEFEEA